jgi:exonuclease III
LILRGATNIHAVKIATWNINGVRGRLPLLLKWPAIAKPDVLALQELQCPDALFPEAELRQTGYDVLWVGGSAPRMAWPCWRERLTRW